VDKKIKAKKVTLLYGQRSLKIRGNQARFSLFRAYSEGNLVRILSFEVFTRMAWTHVDR
jgi:hypothetical protein